MPDKAYRMQPWVRGEKKKPEPVSRPGLRERGCHDKKARGAFRSFHDHQLARQNRVAGLQAIQVHAGGDPAATLIASVPLHLVEARR